MVDVLHYILLQDRQCVYYIFVIVIKIIKYKKNDPWFTMGKNIKVNATTHLSTFPGKGRDTLWLKTQVFRLKTVQINRNKITSFRIQKSHFFG